MRLMFLQVNLAANPKSRPLFWIALKNAVDQSFCLGKVAQLTPAQRQSQDDLLILWVGFEEMLKIGFELAKLFLGFYQQDFSSDLSRRMAQVCCPLATGQGSIIVALKPHLPG